MPSPVEMLLLIASLLGLAYGLYDVTTNLRRSRKLREQLDREIRELDEGIESGRPERNRIVHLKYENAGGEVAEFPLDVDSEESIRKFLAATREKRHDQPARAR